MHGNLFIRTDKHRELQSFAAAVFDLLKVGSASTRESENYATGEYITAQILGLTMKVAVADESEFPDYQFWINFKAHKAWAEESASFDGLADVVAKHLALEGYEVARALAYGKVGGAKVLYKRKAVSGNVRDQLEIQRIN